MLVLVVLLQLGLRDLHVLRVLLLRGLLLHLLDLQLHLAHGRGRIVAGGLAALGLNILNELVDRAVQLPPGAIRRNHELQHRAAEFCALRIGLDHLPHLNQCPAQHLQELGAALLLGLLVGHDGGIGLDIEHK